MDELLITVRRRQKESREYYLTHKEAVKKRARDYYRSHKASTKIVSAAYYKKHRKNILRRVGAYYKENKEVLKPIIRDRSRAAHTAQRNIVIEAYGKVCVCCGETETRFLTIDHAENDGNEHRKKVPGSSLYRWLIRNGFPKDRFRLLCYNCNCGRAHNGGICPHQEVRNES